MQLEFNFVATTYRNSRHELEHELKALLKDFEPIVFFPLKLNSVSYGKLNGDPIRASEILWNLAYSDPWKVRRTLRFVPLEINCNVDTIELKKKAKEIAKKIPAGSSYKIEAELRFSDLNQNELIEIIAEEIKRKVNLEKPEYIVEVQIINKSCGMALLKENMIFKSLEAKLAGSNFP